MLELNLLMMMMFFLHLSVFKFVSAQITLGWCVSLIGLTSKSDTYNRKGIKMH